MNCLIEKSLQVLKNPSRFPKILPHQLASVDFLYKKIINDKENVLLFHKMGSGKTIVSLLLACFITKKNKNIIILLPNNNIKMLWINKINIIKQLIPYDNYNLGLLSFKTKKEFIDYIESNKNKPVKLTKKYTRTLFIIDEAHNFFGNTGSECILLLQKLFAENKDDKPLYILVTGSPITNTLLTLKDLISILSYKVINENDYMIQEGNKIFNFNLTKNGIDIIKKELHDKISYFNQEKSNTPSALYKGQPLIKLPIIPCMMSKEQTKNYYLVKKDVNNEMFLKYLLDVSFTAMGSIQNIQNFENYLKSKKRYQLTDTLYINNGKFQGEELKTLQNSCKLKYFVEKKISNKHNNRSKSFIYFSNSRIGGRFLKDVLKTIGIQEYGNRQLENYICFYCGKEKTCKKCKPLTYIIITSIYLTSFSNIKKDIDNENLEENNYSNSVNSLLEIYNSSNNDNGEEIYFLFGSKIISESYTLRETRDIWFFTIPDSLSEMSQIIARCLRTFSYKDIAKPVKIYVLVAIPNNFNIDILLKNYSKNSIKLTNTSNNKDEINNYVNTLMNEQENYPYDLKKVLYLEIKSKQTNLIHSLFKDLSQKKEEPISKELLPLYIMEMVRRMAYNKIKFTIEELLEYIPNQLLNVAKISGLLDTFIKDGLIVYNYKFNQSFLIKKDNYYYTKPIVLYSNEFLYKIDL